MKLNLLAARILCALLTAFTALSASAVASHDSFEQNGFYYYINSTPNKTLSITFSGDGASSSDADPKLFNTPDIYKGEISIPSKVTYNGITYTVNEINEQAFAGSSYLTSVIIPESVTVIGHSAFRYCTSLTKVTIPKSVTRIDSYAFQNCTELESISLPEKVTYLGFACFYNCINLATLIIPDGVTLINNLFCNGCTNLKSVTLPSSLTSIGRWSFMGCSSLKSIEIPQGVTSIGSSAFNGCRALELITINAIEPPTAVEIPAGQTYGGTFDTWHYENTDLRVPAESIEKYRTAPVWENFFKDRNPLTGIENVEAAEGAESEVVARYDLSGRPVADDYRGMTIVRRADGSTAKEILR